MCCWPSRNSGRNPWPRTGTRWAWWPAVPTPGRTDPLCRRPHLRGHRRGPGMGRRSADDPSSAAAQAGHSVAATGFKGDAVHRLIEGGCALLTVHTNGDSAVGGVSDVLADAFGLCRTSFRWLRGRGRAARGRHRPGGGAARRPPPWRLRPARLQHHAGRGRRRPGGGGSGGAGAPGGGLRRRRRQPFRRRARHQADVYVTADLRHHPASEAREAAVNGRPYLIDVSHFGSEWLWLTPAAGALENVLATRASPRRSGSAAPTPIRGTLS